MEKSKLERQREELQENVKKASNEKILRRQLELLTMYSYDGSMKDRIPEVSQSMLSIYRELLKVRRRFAVLVMAIGGCVFYTLYHVAVNLKCKFQK